MSVSLHPCLSCQSQKGVVALLRELKVVPSKRVSRLEVYRQEDGEDTTVLKDKEKVDWAVGDTLDNQIGRAHV